MTRQIIRWAVPAIALLVLVIFQASCGREAPVYQPGNIFVISSPPGASIFLDGVDTGIVTPDTLKGLETASEPTRYLVSVSLEGFASPEPKTAIVSPLVTTLTDTFFLSETSLFVDSNPTGASIYIEGEDTGLVTPATVIAPPEGQVEVYLELDGYLSSSYTVDVVAGESNEIPPGTFILRSRRTVLFEGFSSVNCGGCSDLAINMEDLMHRDGYGLDRVLYIKYNMNWPGSDLHNAYNPVENDERGMLYLPEVGWGIPSLFMEGSNLTGTSSNSSPFADEIIPFLEGALSVDPGFLIDVTADFSSTDVPVEITITALENVTLAGKTLFVALVQTLIEYDEAPGSEGETEFHHVFRDRADSVDALIDLTSGQTQTINTTLLRDDWDLDKLLVIAFVQNDSDHTIFQAGSSAITIAAPAHQFVNLNQHNPINTSGGDQQ